MTYRPVSYGERDRRLREGCAWADVDGVWHDGQPDADTVAAALAEHCQRRPVHAALVEANDAAREIAEALEVLQAAEARYAAAHKRAHVEAVAAMTRANLAPHDAAHGERVRKYFEK